MENWDMLIGILLVIVFVLLVQRTMSPFRCQEGEEEKNGGCVSNSTKDRWWAFWEEPKCKRGELQSDYTCLASMIWDAVSPGTASSPPAATPAVPSVDLLQYFNRMVDLVEKNFLNTSTDPAQEFGIFISKANACPIDPSAKVNVNVTTKAAFDQQSVKDFQNILDEFYRALNTHGAEEERAKIIWTINQVIQNNMTSENLMNMVTSTINYQRRLIHIDVCSSDSPLRLDEHFPAAAIVSNILMKIGDEVSRVMDKSGGKTEGGLVQDGVQISVENRKVEGNAVMSSQQSQVVTQTAVEAACKPRGFETYNKSVCCSGNTQFNIARARSECT